MEYTLNDYMGLSDIITTQVLLYPNSTEAARLHNHHKSKKDITLSIADCISEHTDRLPMPDELFKYIDESIAIQQRRVIIVGVDPYLSLLSESNVVAFFIALKSRLDIGKQNAVYMLNISYRSRFDAPRYWESRGVVEVSGEAEYCENPVIEVVSTKWVNGEGCLTDYKALLKCLDDFLPTGKHTLIINDLAYEQAGLSNAVTFLLNIHQIAERYYGITPTLKTSTLEALLKKAGSSGMSPESYLEAEFGKSNFDNRLVLKRLLQLPDDDLWEAYIWLVKKRMPVDSYMAKVLASGVEYSNLLRKYAVDELMMVLHSIDSEKFKDERAETLINVEEAETLIIKFIGQTREVESAAKFLNCGTQAERIEIIRRTSKLDLVTGLPDLYKSLYPVLADYLSTEVDYGSADLMNYFWEYRKQKVRNTITPDFVKRAYETSLSAAQPNRDSLLATLRSDTGVALLIVDGIGAEYLPLLLAMAKRRDINIDSYAVASVKLPTSTGYNHILWDKERRLESVRVFDNTAHNGAEKHEINTPERNMEKALSSFASVFNRVATGLIDFNKVVVTADHGSSRLAVLARDMGLSEDIYWDNPLDWRYTIAPEGKVRPPEFEQQYHPDKNKGKGETYWIVRGYNRLTKRGGKPNELHGGASLEERLVPFIVFTRTETATQLNQIRKDTTEQIIDRFDLDI